MARWFKPWPFYLPVGVHLTFEGVMGNHTKTITKNCQAHAVWDISFISSILYLLGGCMILGKLCYPKLFLLIKGAPANIIIICPDNFVFEVHDRVFSKLPKCFSWWRNWWFRALRSRFYDPKNPSPLVWKNPRSECHDWACILKIDVFPGEKRVHVFKPATCVSILIQRVYWLSVAWLAKQMDPCFLYLIGWHSRLPEVRS